MTLHDGVFNKYTDTGCCGTEMLYKVLWKPVHTFNDGLYGNGLESVNLTKMIQKRAHVCPDFVEYPKCVSLLKTGINLNYTWN
jgi:hypothetical protein